MEGESKQGEIHQAWARELEKSASASVRAAARPWVDRALRQRSRSVRLLSRLLQLPTKELDLEREEHLLNSQMTVRTAAGRQEVEASTPRGGRRIRRTYSGP